MKINITIVIPTRNNAAVLRRCLEHVAQAGRGEEAWECLVVDNSDDERKESVRIAVRACQDPKVHYVPMAPLGLMAARHHGAALARGAVIGFIDDDSLLGPSWLRGLAQAFRDPGVVLVCGPIRPEYEIEPPSWVEHFWGRIPQGAYLGYLSLLDLGDTRKMIPPWLVWGCNYSVRRDMFYKVNGSHPDFMPAPWKKFIGDGETALSVKIATLGYQADYMPECAIHHLVPASRLTLDYWGERAFYVGLHSSFTRIRAEHGLGPAQGVPASLAAESRGAYRRLRGWAAKTAAGSFKRAIIRKLFPPPDDASEVGAIRAFLRKRNHEGRMFHRGEVESDRYLLEYVLRPHYMEKNAELPVK